MTTLTTFIAGASLWLSGAWWDREPKASAYALIFAAIMLAIGGLP